MEAARPSRGWWRRASFHCASTYDGEKKQVPKTVVTGAPEQTCSLNVGKCRFTAGLNKHACLDWRLPALNFESTFNLPGNLGYDVLFVKSVIKFSDLLQHARRLSVSSHCKFFCFVFNFKPNLVIHAHERLKETGHQEFRFVLE